MMASHTCDRRLIADQKLGFSALHAIVCCYLVIFYSKLNRPYGTEVSILFYKTVAGSLARSSYFTASTIRKISGNAARVTSAPLAIIASV